MHGVHTSINELNTILVDSIKAATKCTVPNITKEVKTFPWEDSEYQILIGKKLKTKKLVDRKKLEKQIKNRRKHLKKVHYKTLAMEINEHHIARETEKMFSKAKTYSILKETRTNAVSTNDLTKYFKDHFGKKPFVIPPEIGNPSDFLFLEKLKAKIKVDEKPPSTKEVADALKSFKNGKCMGVDGVFGENLKYADSITLVDTLTSLISRIWNGEEEPEEWKLSEITAIYKKKGSRSEAKNY